jgi:hypothetical protein
MLGKRFLCLLIVAAAGLGGACAPVGPPDPDLQRPGPAPAAKGADESQKPLIQLTGQDTLRRRIEAAIQEVRQRDLLTTYGFWTIFHGILGMGPKTRLKDPATGKRVNAIDYICSGGKIKGMQFIPTPYGLDVMTALTEDLKFFAQGHQDQFIAEMAQWGMPLDREFLVDGKKYHFSDFVNQAQMRASTKPGPDGKPPELSWTILIIAQYVGTEAKWTNKDGEQLTLEQLLDYELNAPMTTAACGGTHRLFDLSWVYQLHLKRGGKTEGIWKRIADNAAHYQELAHKYQNADGAFSTDFFNGRGNNPQAQQRIYTTGHVFEWLALSLTDAQLREPWVEDAAAALSKMILDIANQEMEGAALYHAVHGLILYHARVYDRKELEGDLAMVPLPPR